MDADPMIHSIYILVKQKGVLTISIGNLVGMLTQDSLIIMDMKVLSVIKYNNPESPDKQRAG